MRCTCGCCMYGLLQYQACCGVLCIAAAACTACFRALAQHIVWMGRDVPSPGMLACALWCLAMRGSCMLLLWHQFSTAWAVPMDLHARCSFTHHYPVEEALFHATNHMMIRRRNTTVRAYELGGLCMNSYAFKLPDCSLPTASGA